MRAIDFNSVKKLAQQFLDKADALYEQVNAYIDGSNEIDAINAYNEVKALEVVFIKAYNIYYDERNEACLNYELAESVIR